MAKKQKNKKASGGGKGKSKFKLILLLIVSMGMVFVIKYAFIFLAIAVIPSIVAYATDRIPGRLAFQIVTACNLTGALPHLGKLIANNSSEETFFSMAMNPMVWITIYGAAGIGWVIISFTPSIALFVLSSVNNVKIMKLEMMQKKLVEEWGPEIQRKEVV